MGMNSCSPLGKVAHVLLLIGGLNWGLYGLFQMDLVQMVLGSMPVLANAIYVLVGLSAVYAIFACCGGSCKR
jgi:hypothetical protein